MHDNYRQLFSLFKTENWSPDITLHGDLRNYNNWGVLEKDENNQPKRVIVLDCGSLIFNRPIPFEEQNKHVAIRETWKWQNEIFDRLLIGAQINDNGFASSSLDLVRQFNHTFDASPIAGIMPINTGYFLGQRVAEDKPSPKRSRQVDGLAGGMT